MFSNDLICDILDFLDQNINRKISIDELSCRFYFNKDYIMRLFKKEMHCTITEYVNHLRIFYSLKDLQETNLSILSVIDNFKFICSRKIEDWRYKGIK